MPLDVEPNQEFLKFISIQGDKKKFQNIELLLNLERNYPGIFIKVMAEFDKAKSRRESLDENGKPIKVSWEEALKRFYLGSKYERVLEGNGDIAELFGEKGLSQEVVDRATGLREQAKNTNIPEHILGKPIKEETILQSIERIRMQTEEELTRGRQMIEELYDKQFTYEWLNKNDARNFIMGIVCSCCGTITSPTYGSEIAEATILAPDVQNLVVENLKGDIIAKGTMYVNKDKGYAVINNFELNERYKHHEEDSSGRYRVDETNKEEQERELIFKAFQRGLRAFIEEYNRQNPNKPLQQINVGMGHNRLKRQVERFKKATSNLTVPIKYGFIDTMVGKQYILYQRGEQIENGGYDK